MVAQQPGHRLEESDIGSGEKPPGQQDTEKLIEQVQQPSRQRQDNQRAGAGSPVPGKGQKGA